MHSDCRGRIRTCFAKGMRCSSMSLTTSTDISYFLETNEIDDGSGRCLSKLTPRNIPENSKHRGEVCESTVADTSSSVNDKGAKERKRVSRDRP